MVELFYGRKGSSARRDFGGGAHHSVFYLLSFICFRFGRQIRLP